MMNLSTVICFWFLTQGICCYLLNDSCQTNALWLTPAIRSAFELSKSAATPLSYSNPDRRDIAKLIFTRRQYFAEVRGQYGDLCKWSNFVDVTFPPDRYTRINIMRQRVATGGNSQIVINQWMGAQKRDEVVSKAITTPKDSKSACLFIFWRRSYRAMFSGTEPNRH